MNQLNARIRELEELLSQQARMASKLRELTRQQEELTRQAEDAKKIALKEESDVEQLEGSSLKHYLFTLLGNLEEKLDTERQEAIAARIRYEEKKETLQALDRDIWAIRRTIANRRVLEEEYQSLLAQKKEYLIASQQGEEILILEKKAAHLRAQKKEVEEAIHAGKKALSCADSAVHSLESAMGWSTYDLIGGDLIADIAKHEKLHQAEAHAQALNLELHRFRAELADIRIYDSPDIAMDSFTRFADFFLDGLLADLVARDHIQRSKTSVEETRMKILGAIRKLETMDAQITRDLNQAEKAIHRLVMEG